MHRQLADKYEEELLHQQRLKIMVSQIQPHFLYNTIATFKALCKSDPDKAALVAEKFGRYLRENLESLSKAELIPIKEELKHTRIYAEIEMVRFENIRVEYDITDTDFYMPALSIQPIVENAIRHGLEPQVEGGHITVRASTRPGANGPLLVIEVNDTGVGLPGTLPTPGPGQSFGLTQVRERLATLHGASGTLDLIAASAGGTSASVVFPLKSAPNP